jgi:hypothetical protein
MSDQTKGREKNGATPGGKPEAAQSKEDVRRVGKAETRSAGPDGPDATEIGDTFKRKPA